MSFSGAGGEDVAQGGAGAAASSGEAGEAGEAGAGATSDGGGGSGGFEGGSLGLEGPSCAAGLLCAGLSCCQSLVVPATSFPMGRSLQGSDAYSGADPEHPEELPEHQVWVDAFALDTFEVTVGRFRAFVNAFDGTPPAEGAGAHPKIPGSGWRSAWSAYCPDSQKELRAMLEAPYAGPPTPLVAGEHTWTKEAGSNEMRPLNFISWGLAFAFCVWDGGRLPTEAEWEAAAAGGDQNRLYPWGSEPPQGHAPPPDDPHFPLPVGQYPAGQGRWGHLDLGGNVAEWVLDWFDASWYQAHSLPDSCHNCARLEPPMAPGTTDYRVARDAEARVATRDFYSFTPYHNNGFRCARSPK